jgi:D-alanyl-D-alanine carboxypeptidase
VSCGFTASAALSTVHSPLSIAKQMIPPAVPGRQWIVESGQWRGAFSSVLRPAVWDDPKEGAETAPALSRAALASAAAQNARLKRNLRWLFGGKPQRGWALYAPLICATIGAELDASELDFAWEVARWQQNNELMPTGVLNHETWLRLVAQWQAGRSQDRSYPLPDRLITPPASDFYDPERPDELRQVERETYAAYKRMVAAAAADASLGLMVDDDGALAAAETYLKIISAFRSRKYQQQLRRGSPRSGRASLAVNSPHFTGRALDLYVGGEPVSTKDSNRAMQVRTRVYQWLVKHAAEFGFHPYFYEPWHWEYRPQLQSSAQRFSIGTGATASASSKPKTRE